MSFAERVNSTFVIDHTLSLNPHADLKIKHVANCWKKYSEHKHGVTAHFHTQFFHAI